MEKKKNAFLRYRLLIKNRFKTNQLLKNIFKFTFLEIPILIE